MTRPGIEPTTSRTPGERSTTAPEGEVDSVVIMVVAYKTDMSYTKDITNKTDMRQETNMLHIPDMKDITDMSHITDMADTSQ